MTLPTSPVGFINGTIAAYNGDFSGSAAATESNGLSTDGQFWIGSTARNLGKTHINVGTIASSDDSIAIGYVSPNINLTVKSGTTVGKTITGNSGGALSPSAGNWNLLGSGSITNVGSGSTLTTQLTGLTNHAVLVGAGTSTITKIAATANTGAILQNNSGADPSYSTATYPSTTTSQQILYSTAANVVGQLSTANSKFPATNSSGTLAMRAFSVVVQAFTGSGTYTPTAGMLYCTVEVIGAGGGGAGAATTTSTQVASGGGGGGGGYARKTLSAATIGASQTVTIGGGGGGGVGNAAGSTGGATTFGALITANGGGGGLNGSAAIVTSLGGGLGGTSTGGDVNIAGGNGFSSSGAFVTSNSFIVGGFGGFSILGNGGLPPSGTDTGGNGSSGQNYGSGGSGAINGQSNASTRTGGTGAGGIVIVTEYVIA